MSGIVNKAKETVEKMVHKDKHAGETGASGVDTTYDNPQSTNQGPHSGNLTNKADPRVDSDMDHSRNMGAATGGASHAPGYGAHDTGLTGAPGAGLGAGGAQGSGLTGAQGSGLTGAQGSGLTGAQGSGLTGAQGSGLTGAQGSGLTGAHGSGLSGAQGSDLAGGATGYGHNTTGGHAGGATGYGHNTTGGLGSTTSGGGLGGSGPGPAPGTAGPHKSDMLNKADPRVDSNLDGSRTVGGDKTYTE